MCLKSIRRLSYSAKSRANEMAEASGAALLGSIPIDPKLAELCDKGLVEDYDSDVVEKLGNAFSENMKKQSS